VSGGIDLARRAALAAAVCALVAPGYVWRVIGYVIH